VRETRAVTDDPEQAGGRDDRDVYYEVARVRAGAAAPGSTADHEVINFYTRKWIRPEDLNANGTLFGGSLLKWIDEEATIYTIVQLGNPRVVTKFISEINFASSARQGDLVEMGLQATAFGRTSMTMRAHVRNMITRVPILTIDKIVFVSLDEDGLPAPHGFSTITYDRDRFTDTRGGSERATPPG
jgi:acyl-CoA thioesterase YciA